MKTIGFIDYFLNEWHALNYPAWIKQEGQGEFEAVYAWADCEGTAHGRGTNAEFVEKTGMTLLNSMEEVIERSDALILLSPDNPEQHERLAQLPLRAGKPLYIDKTFSENAAEAERMFALAEKSGTPMFSSSALRFSQAWKNLPASRPSGVVSLGGGTLRHYIVHQLEPLVMLLGCDVKRVLCGLAQDSGMPCSYIEFNDGCLVTVTQANGLGFEMIFGYADQAAVRRCVEDAFFNGLIRAMLAFFAGGPLPVQPAETIAIMRLRERLLQASDRPGEWLKF